LLTRMSWSRLRDTQEFWHAVCVLHPSLDSFSSRYYGLLNSLFPNYQTWNLFYLPSHHRSYCYSAALIVG
jgi:hypothetical protein